MKTNLRTIAVALFAISAQAASAQTVAQAWKAFHEPQDTARTKVWWFHGETETTREGITADLEAYKKAGVGGVVYYDQVHKPTDKALEAMSPEWWRMLKFAAQEAHRLGLSFEINVSNGYVMGGKWITKAESMQRLVGGITIVEGGKGKAGTTVLPSPSRDSEAYDVALFAIRMGESANKGIRAITYTTAASGKSRNGAMNTPGSPDGMLFTERPPVGVLEASDDSIHWRTVCQLPPVYGSPTWTGQTVGFPAVQARHFRTRITDPAVLERKNSAAFIRDVQLSALPRLTNWEERVGLRSEFIEPIDYSPYADCAISQSDIMDISGKLNGDKLNWQVPKGKWAILRIVAETTKGRSKHGRANLMGLEADNLSPRGVLKHWANYTKPIIDTLAAIGLKPQGVTMDSHEAGAQNWTQDFEQEFRRRRGYDLRPWLPAMVGYVVGSAAKTDSVLADVRLTIADMICDRYLATLQRLCREEGVTLTAQAMGNGLSIAADNFRAKSMVDKPQGEFWARDKNGSYDIKECASAAHRYGKPIASGEAFTDMNYSQTLADMKPLADYAYSCHINEFVVCASAYQPWLDKRPGSTGGGRHYCLNRCNTLWDGSRGFWDYQARCAAMMRQGKPVTDIIAKLPSTPPTKLLARRLPAIPPGYSWEVTTEPGDKGTAAPPATPDLTDYSAHQPDNTVWFSHRKLADGDLYFVANHNDSAYHAPISLRTAYDRAYFWNPTDGTRQLMDGVQREGEKLTMPLHLEPNESGFVVATNGKVNGLEVRPFNQRPLETISIDRCDMAFGSEGITLKNQTLADWTQNSNPRIKYFSGMCDYTASFKVRKSAPDNRWTLRLPPVNGNVEVIVNGHDAGVIWCSPWTIDLTKHIKKGTNRLQLRVSNVLANRIIGDAGLPEAERVTYSQPQIYTSGDRLKPSGIFGGAIKIEKY